MSFLGKIFGDSNERYLKSLEPAIERIDSLEKDFKKLSAEELKNSTVKLKERLKNGETSDEILPEAFAAVREAASRVLNQRPFDSQLIGGMAINRGAVAEMATGEGKTLAAVAPAYLNALAGGGVHIVTVNEYLARRDAVWMGKIYRSLGLEVSCLVPNSAFLYDPEWEVSEDALELINKEEEATGSFLVQQEFLKPITRREAYKADIVYGTNHEFGFDYLRDNLAYNFEDQVQGGRGFAIIDEVDSILIDEARTPLIISAPDMESSEFYKVFARISDKLSAEEDYTVDEKFKTVSVTSEGITKVEKFIGVNNLYAPENLRLVHYLEESLKAKVVFKRDKDYVVKNGEVIIVDEFTGRMLQGRRYSGGLHQAIEAKENVRVKEESRTYAKISIQNYFRLYKKISGMTGTAQTSAEEFYKVYNLEVISIPTNRPLARKELADLVYKNSEAKWQAVVKDIKEKQEKGQPVLVGTTSIQKNELISEKLSDAGILHEVLNAKNNEHEGAIIAQAGKLKAVTVATNMAGRGVDIILGGNPSTPEEAAKVRETGGLHVIGTERHEARRIDNQLRGRSGRQGDPGSAQFFLSLEDDLLRVFGGDKIKGMMESFNLPEDQPIQAGFLSKVIAQAQAKVEGFNFDLRKRLLEYDDVLNRQRTSIYVERQKILESMRKEDVADLIFKAVREYLENGIFGEEHDVPAIANEELKKMFEDGGLTDKENSFPEKTDFDSLSDFLKKRSSDVSVDPLSKNRLLSILDLLWMSQLEDLEALSESVGLRAYGQRDPVVEYRQEAHRLFRDFWNNFNGWVFMNIFKLARVDANSQQMIAAVPHNHPHAAGAASGDKVGRNDPCPCGSGKKYKKCHGA
ncbi:MAG TPA: preprotein translocase subunit SecA [Candidatus Paceibacterota bacterium]|nr:preprotein translocase subunit SecA [Candidatus Paceibacterota bacterium]